MSPHLVFYMKITSSPNARLSHMTGEIVDIQLQQQAGFGIGKAMKSHPGMSEYFLL